MWRACSGRPARRRGWWPARPGRGPGSWGRARSPGDRPGLAEHDVALLGRRLDDGAVAVTPHLRHDGVLGPHLVGEAALERAEGVHVTAEHAGAHGPAHEAEGAQAVVARRVEARHLRELRVDVEGVAVAGPAVDRRLFRKGLVLDHPVGVPEIGGAHVWTPVTNENRVCSAL